MVRFRGWGVRLDGQVRGWGVRLDGQVRGWGVRLDGQVLQQLRTMCKCCNNNI